MSTERKTKLINNYNNLKRKKVPRWEEVAKKTLGRKTTAVINLLMTNEIENLRSYIHQLKTIGTMVINHKENITEGEKCE